MSRRYHIVGIVVAALLYVQSIPLVAQTNHVQQLYIDNDKVKDEMKKQSAIVCKNLIDSAKADKYKKDYKEAFTNRLTFVQELLQSSALLTENAAHQYLQDVLTQILNANPTLKPLNIRIAFHRSIEPNAVCFGDGTIVVYAGLVVRLHNEAELAAVICHELAHQYLNHSNKKIAQVVALSNDKKYIGDLKKLQKKEYGVNAEYEKLMDEIAFNFGKQSRETENEADAIGLQLLANTKYDTKYFVSLLEVLDKIDDQVYDKIDITKMFHFSNYPFKNKWIEDEETSLFADMKKAEETEAQKNKNEKLKTHPDCKERITNTQKKLTNIAGKDFIVNKNYFLQLQEALKLEMVEQLYKKGNYSGNLYYALTMIDKRQNEAFAIYSALRCLNAITEAQKTHTLGMHINKESRFDNKEVQLFLRVLDRLSPKEQIELAYYFALHYQNQMKPFAAYTTELNKAITYYKQL